MKLDNRTSQIHSSGVGSIHRIPKAHFSRHEVSLRAFTPFLALQPRESAPFHSYSNARAFYFMPSRAIRV